MKTQYQNIRLFNNFTVDFNKLAILQPSLKQNVFILNDRVVWNFASQQSLIKLTKAIMKHIFKYQWLCPTTNLCPRIPSRVNYLLWLFIQIKEQIDKVVDVGTGATLIYPLIGWALFKWHFIAIEINENSYNSSKQIIKINHLEQKVDLRLSKSSQLETILFPIIEEKQSISLVICNPPFFEQDSPTLSQMEHQEHHTQFGQYGFFFILYKDSFRYQNIKYFSCLIGRITDFEEIKRFMIHQKQQGFLQMLRFGEIVQGKNKRFIILWRIKHELI